MGATIEVIGLGAGDIEQLPLGIYRKLRKSNELIFTRTMDHPVIAALQDEGICFHAFDEVYEQYDTFEQVYQQIVQTLIEKAKQTTTLVYTVPGHPMLAEKTVQLLLESSEVEVVIAGGQSYLDSLFSALKIDPIDGFQFLDATNFVRNQVDYRNHLIFCQVYDRFIASEVKLTLLEDLKPEHPIKVVEAVGSQRERIQDIPLVELDQSVELSNLTSVYVAPSQPEMLNHQFFRLRETIATLRGPSGCPWDKKQTNVSLRKYLIEEAYELIDAINKEDDEAIIEELGDVLLQVMLHSQIGEDLGFFTIDEVIKGITNKMIRRHPHVFADAKITDEQELNDRWQAIKAEEKATRHSVSAFLDRVPASASPLVKATELQKEAEKVGFTFATKEQAWKQLIAQLTTYKESVDQLAESDLEQQFGDILFAIVQVASYDKVNTSLGLEQANQTFIQRVLRVEKMLKAKGQSLHSSSSEVLNTLWKQTKS